MIEQDGRVGFRLKQMLDYPPLSLAADELDALCIQRQIYTC